METEEGADLSLKVRREIYDDSLIDFYCGSSTLVGLLVENPEAYEALVEFNEGLSEMSEVSDMHDDNIGWFEDEYMFKIIDLGYFDSSRFSPDIEGMN